MLASTSKSRRSFLVVSAAQQLYALPLEAVVETMRPLPLQKLQSSVESVAGVSRIRGAAVPVIHLASLVSRAASVPERFISMKIGSRAFALAVDSVLGIHELNTALAQELPTLMQVNPGVRATAELHRELMFYIEPIHLVPETVWQQMKDATA